MNIKIFNLSHNITDSALQRMFSAFGIVDSVTIDRNRLNGRSNGNGWVDMPVEKEAKQAILSLDQSMVDGKRISVSELATDPKR
jgi:RNA recognition motif-containing protein